MRGGIGLTVLVGLLIAGLATLAGGYLWALSGSLGLGGAAGLVVAAALAVAARSLGRHGRSRGHLGEVQKATRPEDFTTVVPGGMATASRRRGLAVSPDKAAGGIRSMLNRGKGASR